MKLRQPNLHTIPGVKRVFVTGAAGLIGSHLVERLLAENFEVVGYDNFSTGHKLFLKPVWLHPSFTMVQGELSDTSLMASAMSGCDMVYHLAGKSTPGSDFRHPSLDLEQNSLGTLQVMQAMLSAKVARLLFVSSSAVYGSRPTEPVSESTPMSTVDTLYGVSMLASEGIIQTYARRFRLQATILRSSSVIGPRSWRHLVGDIYRMLTLKPTELDLPLPPNQRYHVMHVADLVNASLHLLGHHTSQPQYGGVAIYNAALSEICRATDLIRCVCRPQGLLPVVRMAPGTAPGQYVEQVIQTDATRLHQMGWIPLYSTQDAIYQTVEWLRQNHWALGEPYDQLSPPSPQFKANAAPPAATVAPAPPSTPRKRSLIRDLLPGES